jgi:hypothetical protein
MFRKALVALAASVVAIAVPSAANAVYALVDFESATDALYAVDPTIEPAANNSARDFVVGGFHGIEGNNVGFSAHSDPLGLDAEGKLSETIPQFFGTVPATFQGRFRVICLVTLGNEAALGLVPTAAASNDIPAEFVLAVRDNRSLGLPDEYAFIPFVPAAACAVGVTFAAFPIESGNILVNDALP